MDSARGPQRPAPTGRTPGRRDPAPRRPGPGRLRDLPTRGSAAVTAGIFRLVVVLRRGRAWRRFRLPGADRSRESARIDVPARVSRNRSSCGPSSFIRCVTYKIGTTERYRPVTVTSRRGSAPHAPILGFRARPRPRPQLGLGLAFCTACIGSLNHPAVLSVSLSLSAIAARCMGRRRARTREYADDRGVNVQMIGVRRRGGTSGGSGRHSNCRRGDEDSIWTQWALRTSA